MAYPNSLFAAIAELDAIEVSKQEGETLNDWLKRKDLRYRDLLSTGSKTPPHKSIGWRGKAVLYAGNRVLREGVSK
jgi:hypothetical protein